MTQEPGALDPAVDDARPADDFAAADPDAPARPMLGAFAVDGGTRFAAFCTTSTRVGVQLYDRDGRARARYALAPVSGQPGYFQSVLAGVEAGARYKLILDDRELPDPYARWLPDGVHGAAEVVGPGRAFAHPQVVRPLSEHVIYELHVGTFTAAGTYAAAQARLPYLAELGITTIELMPVAAFAGTRGWGYDGVAPYAPFAPYGTPDELRAFVDEAHRLGLAVLLDVVYNHLGPAGNYLSAFSPDYFTSAIRNAWGDSFNFAHLQVRRLVIDNALYWLREFHFDGLRLDAIHAIIDPSPVHVLRELAHEVARHAPDAVLIGEDDRNDRAAIAQLGLHALWADDFHHGVRVTLTGERDGYYAAYHAGTAALAETIAGGWFYCGQTYPPTGAARGCPAPDLPAAAFVYCIQNHDQVGNRAFGDRLATAVPDAAYRAASTLLLFLPMTPLIFMGQEWGARTPFQFFTDHEADLGALITEGRRREFAAFEAMTDPARRALIPDPQDPATFARSRLDWDEARQLDRRAVLQLYRQLLQLRREDPVLRAAGREGLQARALGPLLLVRRFTSHGQRHLLVNLSNATVPWPKEVEDLASAELLLASVPLPAGRASLPPYAAAIFAT